MLTVLVMAAGSGTRMQSSMNKMFLDLCGEPVLCRTLERLHLCPSINELILVAALADLPMWQELKLEQRFPKLQRIVVGGSTRQASVGAGLKALAPDCDYVAIHDGARPLLQPADAEKLFISGCEAAILAVKAKDSIKVGQEFIQSSLDRNEIWLAQTPQFFARGLICRAYEQAQASGQEYSDDASLVSALGVEVALVTGSYSNLKVTTPEDYIIAEAIWRWQNASG